MSVPIVQYQTYQQTTAQPTEPSSVKTKEYYVRVSKSRKKFHAIKFNTGSVELTQFNKPEMSRDISNIPTYRADWENMPKQGQGSEFNRENKELARRRKFGFMPKKIQADDLPWLLTNKGNEKEKTKDKQYIGKKSISENSCYFVFIKCADGGFEAHPLEDWYSFAPHKTYKTLDIDEAEEEFKRRNKVLNKYMIMANKRKAEGDGDEEEEENKKAPKKGGKRQSNLSDDDEDDAKKKKQPKPKPKKRSEDDDDAPRDMEDSDDGDHEGREKDYSDTGSEGEEPEPDTAKYDEKYEEKGIDEEEAIKAMEKLSDDEEEEEDEDLTEEGKEYKKLMSKKDEEDEEFDEFFKTGKIGKEEGESKDSSSDFDEMDLDDKKSKTPGESGKMKRKATDGLQKSGKKLQKTASGTLQTHDESSSSSTTSTAQTSKASKTAAIIAAVQAKSGQVAPSPPPKVEGSALTEEEVRRYLSRKPMTTKELLHKFRAKTQDKMSKDELCKSLKTILDKLNAKMVEQNGVKYLSLP